jgi:hypothetical protein
LDLTLVLPGKAIGATGFQAAVAPRNTLVSGNQGFAGFAEEVRRMSILRKGAVSEGEALALPGGC